jgi:hypothetical protein
MAVAALTDAGAGLTKLVPLGATTGAGSALAASLLALFALGEAAGAGVGWALAAVAQSATAATTALAAVSAHATEDLADAPEKRFEKNTIPPD